MSYILDALKKAEAERNADTPTHLYVPPVFTSPPVSEESRWDRPWVWAGTSAGLVAAFALAWFKPWQVAQSPLSPIAQAVETAPSAAVAAATAVPPPPSAALPAGTKTSAETKAPSETLKQPDAEGAKKQPAEKIAKVPDKPAKAAVEKKVPAAERAAVPERPATAKKPPAPSVAAKEEAVMARSDLPLQIQQEIPLISVNGYLYSGNQADRSVLINNRLAREGEEIAPGLVLEKMLPNGMVLNYKGYRYRTGY